jgi:hypothetical protein
MVIINKMTQQKHESKNVQKSFYIVGYILEPTLEFGGFLTEFFSFLFEIWQ